MNWAMWTRIETALDKYGVKPLIAIVPDNKDSALEFAPARDNFWETVRGWKAKGWAIAMHGYQHLYVTSDSGILRLNARSEFAGLPHGEQRKKLQKAMDIFLGEGIKPDAWVAPSHSFDGVTVRVLREIGLRTISDGLFPWPHRDRMGMLWLPQQIWRFRTMPPGVWTVCFHHNDWSDAQMRNFARDLKRFHPQIANPFDICSEYADRRKTVADQIAAAAMFRLILAADCYGRFLHRPARKPVRIRVNAN